MKNYYDLRTNIQNRPSVSNRTIRVIHELMNDEGVAMGVAIEMLMRSGKLWDSYIDKIAKFDKSIKEKN